MVLKIIRCHNYLELYSIWNVCLGLSKHCSHLHNGCKKSSNAPLSRSQLGVWHLVPFNVQVDSKLCQFSCDTLKILPCFRKRWHVRSNRCVQWCSLTYTHSRWLDKYMPTSSTLLCVSSEGPSKMIVFLIICSRGTPYERQTEIHASTHTHTHTHTYSHTHTHAWKYQRTTTS